MHRYVVLALTLGMALGSCGGVSASMRAARQGDLVALRTAIATERARCVLDQADVRELAKLTAERELTRSAPGETISRIDEARACARPLSGTLEGLARQSGDVGAAATLALLDGRTGDKDGERQLRRYGASPNPLWRAVAARSAIGEELGPA